MTYEQVMNMLTKQFHDVNEEIQRLQGESPSASYDELEKQCSGDPQKIAKALNENPDIYRDYLESQYPDNDYHKQYTVAKQASDTKDAIWQDIEAEAKERMKKNPKLTRAKAINDVLISKPRLYQTYINS